MLKRIPRRNHITPVLRELHWLEIHDRIIFKILHLTDKAVNNIIVYSGMRLVFPIAMHTI